MTEKFARDDKQHTVAMFHIGRSGSTVLGDMLDQHPDVHWDGEIYELPLDALGYSRQELTRLAQSGSRVDPVQFLARRRRESTARCYGFEVKFFHLDIVQLTLADYLRQLSALGVDRFIVLMRRNTLRKIVSSLIAHETGRFHLTEAGQVSRHRIRVDPDNVSIDRESKPLLDFLADYDEKFSTLNRLLGEKDVLSLTYEDDVQPGPEIGYGKVCGYLNIAHLEAGTNFVRTNPYPLRELVVNYEDVRVLLRGTEYAWMLDG